MTEIGKIVLHSFHSSSSAWRVRIALAFKEIPYEVKSWNLLTGEHLSEEYRKICPAQLVPALEIDGQIITNSIAILEFLEERFPDKKSLLPKDIHKRPAVRSFVNDIAAGIQPLTSVRVQKYLTQNFGQDPKKEWVHTWLDKGLTALETVAEKHAGKFSFGDEFTMGDALLAPQLKNAIGNGVDLGKYPTLQKLGKTLLENEFVYKARPEVQPDYPSST